MPKPKTAAAQLSLKDMLIDCARGIFMPPKPATTLAGMMHDDMQALAGRVHPAVADPHPTVTQTEALPAQRPVRTGDPDTSQDAATSVSEAHHYRSQRDVLMLLREVGPSTDEEFESCYSHALASGRTLMHQTPQSLRSRRAELVRAGAVRWTGEKRRTHTGRNSRVWEAV